MLVIPPRHGKAVLNLNDFFRARFMEQFAESAKLSFAELSAGLADARRASMMPYQREVEDALSGRHRLQRARRLIERGGRRRIKRAIRLHRLVYGPHFNLNRIKMMIAQAALRRRAGQ